MQDMLVRLYAIPSVEEALAACAKRGVTIRRALSAVLTQMVLAGMRRSEIVAIVAHELRGLTKGASS